MQVSRFFCVHMNNLLKNKKGIIFGAIDERSIAWSVALKCAEEGATFVLTNTPSALQLGTITNLAAARDWQIIPCDATNVDDIRNLYTQATTLLGGKIDFVLHAVAQSVNLRRRKEYDSLNYDYFHKTLDISALSLHKILQTAIHTDSLSEGASVVTLSYIASDRFVAGYGDMGDAKAMLESIVRQWEPLMDDSKKCVLMPFHNPLFSRARARVGTRVDIIANIRKPYLPSVMQMLTIVLICALRYFRI